MNKESIKNLSLEELFKYKGYLDELSDIYTDVQTPFYGQMAGQALTAEQAEAHRKHAKAQSYLNTIIATIENKIYDEIDNIKDVKKNSKKN